MIGISVDSLNDECNRLIGRCDKLGAVIPYNKLVLLCKNIKEIGIKLKINICVSKNNIKEDFTDFLYEIQPDRLKLLQMTIDEGVNDDSFFKKLQYQNLINFLKNIVYLLR